MSVWRNLKISKCKAAGSYFRTIIALLLVVSALMSTTYAWLQNELYDSLHTKSYITVSADGLIVETDDHQIQDKISIKEYGAELAECTSPDGRNFYFPTSNFDKEFNPVFRRADTNDRNSKYISFDFYLTSDKDTDVWISNESYILGRAANAARISLVLDEDASSVLILDGSETAETTTDITILDVDDIYKTKTETTQVSNSLYRYFYTANANLSGVVSSIVADKQLLQLKSGETRKITMNVWLEGWDSDCVNGEYNCKDELGCGFCDVYDKDDLQINLKFTVGLSDCNVFMFSDASAETWTSHPQVKLFNYEDFWQIDNRRVFMRDKDTDIIYSMSRLAAKETVSSVVKYFYHWTATVPSTVVNVEFIRLDHRNGVHFGVPTDEVDFEFWDAGSIEGKNTVKYRRFYALEGCNYGEDSTNVGRWANSYSVETVYFIDYDSDVVRETKIYYEAQASYYGTTPSEITMRMTYVTTSDDGGKVYAARIPSSASEFVFIQPGYKTYDAGSRSRSTYNLYSTLTGKWSKNTSYPTN